jgi:altronate dehydratase
VSSEQSSIGGHQAVIVISAADNVGTALESIAAGQTIAAGASTVTAAEPIPRGHKIALRAIRAGDVVMKYGNAIGTASLDIPAGAHVHTHNVASGRGRGDLGQ